MYSGVARMMIRLGDCLTASERVAFGLNWSRCNKSNNPRNRIIDPLGGCNKIHLCSCLGERLFNLWVHGWVFAVQSTHVCLCPARLLSLYCHQACVSEADSPPGSRPQIGAELGGGRSLIAPSCSGAFYNYYNGHH